MAHKRVTFNERDVRSLSLGESMKRGISLMEVLISMFILAVGLLGVAALIPAGRHEIVEATKLETSAMVGRNAVRDMQVRGYLNPANWRDAVSGTGTFGYRESLAPKCFTYTNPASVDPVDYSEQLAVVVDPMGLTAPTSFTTAFPYGYTSTTPPALRRIIPFQPSSAAAAFACFDTVFRSSVDLNTKGNANKDLPPTQEFFRDPPGPTGTAMRRQSLGNYSWLATITSEPSRPAVSGQVNVAVAVFFKRDLSAAGAGERTATVHAFALEPPATLGDPAPGNAAIRKTRMPSGGEIEITNLSLGTDGKPKGMKPGQWLMLAGYEMLTPIPPPVLPPVQKNHFGWYRVLAASKPGENARGYVTQRLTLSGQDWKVNAGNTSVWMFDNIVSVYEKSLPLEQ